MDTEGQPPATPPTPPAAAPVTQEDMKRAYKAFKKRLKLTQLDEDSRLGHSPLTGSKNSVVAIQPPAGHGRAVWEALADAGYLKRERGGMYELVPGKQLS